MSRTYKELPRPETHFMFAQYPNLDGELIVGDPTDGDVVYNRTQSYVMSADERPMLDLRYYVFDLANEKHLNAPFKLRLATAQAIVIQAKDPQLYYVEHRLIWSYEELIAFEEECLEAGYEGIMIRDPEGPYKNGRSTMRQGWLIKLKRFEDLELKIVGFEEAFENTNEDVRSELGYAKRSQSKEGLIPSGTLGKFLVEFQGQVVPVSCGSFKHHERQHIWDNQEVYFGELLKVRHFPKGVKDLLRFPRAIGFRDLIDM
jgi:DNA ligase-1